MSVSVNRNIDYALAQRVIAAANNHMASTGGGTYQQWYAGITCNPQQRLSEHGADASAYPKVYDCGNDDTARYVEQHFLAKGCKGNGGGGDNRGRYFYVYKINYKTRP
jgi:hypothetical protein